MGRLGFSTQDTRQFPRSHSCTQMLNRGAHGHAMPGTSALLSNTFTATATSDFVPDNPQSAAVGTLRYRFLTSEQAHAQISLDIHGRDQRATNIDNSIRVHSRDWPPRSLHWIRLCRTSACHTQLWTFGEEIDIPVNDTENVYNDVQPSAELQIGKASSVMLTARDFCPPVIDEYLEVSGRGKSKSGQQRRSQGERMISCGQSMASSWSRPAKSMLEGRCLESVCQKSLILVTAKERRAIGWSCRERLI